MSHEVAKWGLVLDVDRTILDTDALVDALISHARAMSGGEDIANQIAVTEREARGKSFDLIGELAKVQRLATYEQLESSAPALVYDGVAELMAFTQQRNIPVMLLTFGSLGGQALKVALLESVLDRRLPKVILTEDSSKALWIAERRQADVYELTDDAGESIYCHEVILFDDKEKNLTPKDEHIYPVHIDHKGQTGGITLIQAISELQERIDRP